MKMNLHSHIRIALFYFLVVAILGCLLRLFVVVDISATYRFLVHTHSHVALLGWVYVALTSLFYKLYLEKVKVKKLYSRIFWFTQITILGMLISFPFHGYAAFSILFSTLFLIASYFFALLFLKKSTSETKKLFSYKLAKTSILFMVFSSIGPWALGAIMTTLGSTSIWYKLAIYFYLHFQYNGWFIIGLLGILFYFLEKFGIFVPIKLQKQWLCILVSSVLLTYFLSTLWLEPSFIIYFLAAIGAILQTILFLKIFLWLQPVWNYFSKQLIPMVSTMLLWAGLLLAIKIDMQLLSAIPYFAMLAYHTLDFVIGYLHLVFLGVVTISLFAFLKQTELLNLPKVLFYFYLIAFLSTELLLFYKGSAIWLDLPIPKLYYFYLIMGSVLFPIAIIVLILYQLKKNKIQ